MQSEYEISERFYRSKPEEAVWAVPSCSPYCHRCPESPDAEGGLICASRIANFRLNRNTLRFLHTYLFGYWNSTPSDEAEASNTPFVGIGKCGRM